MKTRKRTVSAAVKNLRDEYMQNNSRCELKAAAGQYLKGWVRTQSRLHLHHILGRGKGLEIVENYAAVDGMLHDWLHNTGNRHVTEIALFWWKWRKGEWDLSAWEESGKRPLGRVEAELMRDRLPAWCRRLGEELVEGNR